MLLLRTLYRKRTFVFQSTRLIPNNVKYWETSGKIFFCVSALNKLPSTPVVFHRRSTVDSNNVFTSPFEDINIPLRQAHESIWENAGNWWHKIALINAASGKSYTYSELRKLSGKLATSLRKNKLNNGDSLAVILPNIPEYFIVALAASQAGIKLTLLNPAYTPFEMSRQIHHSEACAVITIPEKFPTVKEVINSKEISLRIPTIVVPTGSEPVPEGTINFNELVADGIIEFEKTGEQLSIDLVKDTFLLPYSSGTTGLPKGVELTHNCIVSNFYQLSHPEYSLDEPAIGDHQEVIPAFLPLYHIYGQTICLFYLSIGAKIVCIPKFSPNALLDVFEKHKTSLLYVAPPVIGLIVNNQAFKKAHLSHAKSVFSGAAPIGLELITKFQEKMGTHFKFTQGYGLTETSPLISRSKDADIQSSGFIAVNTRLRVVGSDERGVAINLGCGKVGEIFVKGPQVMKGYLKNQEATSQCMEGEWFKTGDIGYVDAKGQLFITGRMKELIKVKGLQVAPAELENVIVGHEKVADVAVVGVPHEKSGEIPKAFVVRKQGVTLSEEEVKDFVAQRLSKHKHLGQVVFIDSIPKSAAGKILRRELMEM